MDSELLREYENQQHNEQKIPIEDLGLLRMNPNEQESLVNVRLKANDLKWRIFRQICGYTDIEEDGRVYLVPSKHFEGMIPIASALKIIRTIEFMVNSNIRLGYIRDEEALHEYKQVYVDLAVSLVLDEHWQNVPVYVKDEVMSLLAPNIFHSISGAIGGKEAKHIVTTISEQKAETQMHEKVEGIKPKMFGLGGQ